MSENNRYFLASQPLIAPEDGYKIVSRDVLEDEVSKTFMNQISIVDKKYKLENSINWEIAIVKEIGQFQTKIES